MKWIVSKLRPETISAVLSALIYNEKSFIGLVWSLFGFKTYFCDTDKLATYRYAAVLDEANKRLYIVFRGTDGKNWFGRLLSWTRINLCLKIDPEGFHTGFRMIAEKAMADMAPWINQAVEVFVCGHSQGCGTGTVFVALLCRKIIAKMLPNLKRFEVDLFCSPPAVNDVGKIEIDEYIADEIVEIRNYKMEGDLVSGGFFRKKNGLLAGRDVGTLIVLTDAIRKKYWFADPVSHSPTLILMGFALWLHQNFETTTNGDKALVNHILNEYYLVN